MENLGVKLQTLINEYKEGDKLKVCSTSSEDNHVKIHEHIWGSAISLEILESALIDFTQYGECAGCNPKGVWIKDIDFELVN